MKSKILLALTVALALGVGLIGTAMAGDHPNFPRDLDKAQVVPGQANAVTPEPEVAGPFGLSAALQEDGRWAIAGVVGLSRDVLGRRVIEVNKDGDFETDTVLSLFVPLVELDTGEVAASGIVSVKSNTDTVTLTVRNPASSAGTVAGVGLGGCEGAMDEDGNFTCVPTYPDRTTGCIKIKILDVTFCDCGAAK